MALGPLRLFSPDRSLLLARQGYLFTARLKEDERRKLYETGALGIRFLGRPALVVTGAVGVDLFYDESSLQRHKAIPPPIALSLFGPGAVHALDDDAHRHRKALFRHALSESGLDRLVVITESRWRDAVDTGRRPAAERCTRPRSTSSAPASSSGRASTNPAMPRADTHDGWLT